jgi:hypothetical protein
MWTLTTSIGLIEESSDILEEPFAPVSCHVKGDTLGVFETSEDTYNYT